MSAGPSVRISRLLLMLWFAALFAMAVLALQPEANRVSRLSAVGLVLGLLATCIGFIWSQKRTRNVCLVVLGGVALLLALPWRIHTSPETLRASYVERLRTYEGCKFYWGGESRRGIDCSGLIRRGLIDASLYQGIAHFDPGLIRHGLSLWWNDTSAKALGEEYQGLTRRLLGGNDLKTLDYSKLQAGDIAVTADGVHIMAYLGREVWIEADPGEHKVITVHAPTTTNSWFLYRINILRWRVLSE